MKLRETVCGWFGRPALTRTRIWFAFSVAVLVDGLQLALGPIGWVVPDQALDLVAMALTTAALGFHMLLLPTFVLELFPVADWLPTWTGCVAAVVMLRRRVQAAESSPVVEVAAERVSVTPPRAIGAPDSSGPEAVSRAEPPKAQ